MAGLIDCCPGRPKAKELEDSASKKRFIMLKGDMRVSEMMFQERKVFECPQSFSLVFTRIHGEEKAKEEELYRVRMVILGIERERKGRRRDSGPSATPR